MGKGGGGGRGSSGGGGRGHGGGSGYRPVFRFRIVRGFFGWHSAETSEMLKRVAAARGLRDSDALLVALGKEKTGISGLEAMELMEKELGFAAMKDVLDSKLYARGMSDKPCQTLLRNYKELAEAVNKSLDDEEWQEYYKDKLSKYCRYNVDGKK